MRSSPPSSRRLIPSCAAGPSRSAVSGEASSPLPATRHGKWASTRPCPPLGRKSSAPASSCCRVTSTNTSASRISCSRMPMTSRPSSSRPRLMNATSISMAHGKPRPAMPPRRCRKPSLKASNSPFPSASGQTSSSPRSPASCASRTASSKWLQGMSRASSGL